MINDSLKASLSRVHPSSSTKVYLFARARRLLPTEGIFYAVRIRVSRRQRTRAYSEISKSELDHLDS